MKWWYRLFEEVKPEPKPEVSSNLLGLLRQYKQCLINHTRNDCHYGRVGSNPYTEELLAIEKALEKYL